MCRHRRHNVRKKSFYQSSYIKANVKITGTLVGTATMPPAAATPEMQTNRQTARDATMRPLQTYRKYHIIKEYGNNKIHHSVGAVIDRPPPSRQCELTGKPHRRAMLAPTRIFRRYVALFFKSPPRAANHIYYLLFFIYYLEDVIYYLEEKEFP